MGGHASDFTGDTPLMRGMIARGGTSTNRENPEYPLLID